MLAIIILNYNHSLLTVDAVNSILKSTFTSFKLLVVDNGSSEEDFHCLKVGLPKDGRINLHRIEENKGYVGGTNYGLEQASLLNPDYFLVINNDVIIDKVAISELIHSSQINNDEVIVTGKTYDFGTDIIQYIGDELVDESVLKYARIGAGEIDAGQYDTDAFRDMIDDIYWLIPKQIYSSVGLYSSLYWFNGESADYALRAMSKGYKLFFCHKAKLWHKGSVSIGGRGINPAKGYWIRQSASLLRSKYLIPSAYKRYKRKAYKSILINLIKGVIKCSPSRLRYSYAMMRGEFSVRKVLSVGINSGYNPFLR